MHKPLWIRNGRVIDPSQNIDEVRDIFVLNGKFAETLPENQRDQCREIDATDKIVAPGLIDIHVHFREPGQTHKETILSGSQAAAAGGFTTVVCMPNTSPPADNPGTIQYILDTIRRDAVVNVLTTGCITAGMEGKHLAPIGSLKRAGVVGITDDGKCVQNNEIMRRAVEYAKMFDLVVMDHCQDENLTESAVMNEGAWSTRLGLKGWPSAAEDVIVSRNIILSTLTGAHIHMQHISSGNAVDILRRAKQRGVRVTAEASPHHIALTDEAVRTYDTNFKMNPPLRTEADRLAIIEGLKDGTIDLIATDHAPHTDYEKDCEFDYAPFGIIGLETSLAVTLGTLYHTGEMSLSDILALMTHKPAAIIQSDRGTLKPGEAGDVTIFDPDEEWTLELDDLKSQSQNSPWLGERLKGRVKMTIVAGRVVYESDP
ncbi:MAG TPA: dihydroorotase [Opitutales bacterium]|nr:dihydroorotase [Opitutales bacterium]